MNILPSVSIPGPFGTLHAPALETPPFKLPTVPDAHGKQAIRHAVGQDVADISDTIFEAIPGAGVVGAVLGPVRESIMDMHAKEIRDSLTPAEYNDFLEYNKIFPSTVAMARVMCFKEAKTVRSAARQVGSILPMSPRDGPPLPRGLGVYWPRSVMSAIEEGERK